MASTSGVSTADLLRNALVVAHRLAVPELVDWIGNELNGYKDKEVPAYRKLIANIQSALAPGETKAIAKVSVAEIQKLFDSIAQVDVVEPVSFVEGQALRKDQYLLTTLPPKVNHLMLRDIGNFTVGRVLSPIHYQGILDAIKTIILNWALDLESRGILGDGKSLTVEEKEVVQQIHNHFSNISGSQIQINSCGSSQIQASTAKDLQSLRDLIEALGIVTENATGDVAAELRAELVILRTQAESPKPKWDVIKSAARSFKAVAEGATGNILANLAQPHLDWLTALTVGISHIR